MKRRYDDGWLETDYITYIKNLVVFYENMLLNDSLDIILVREYIKDIIGNINLFGTDYYGVGNYCYVYVMQDDENGLIKIGYSIDPVTRMKSLGKNIKLLISFIFIDVSTARVFERVIHNYFSQSRIEHPSCPNMGGYTEFFNLPPYVAISKMDEFYYTNMHAEMEHLIETPIKVVRENYSADISNLLPIVPKHQRGFLSDEAILNIFKRSKEGDSYRSIAQKYGISPGMISSILHRRTYKYVDVPEELLLDGLVDRTSRMRKLTPKEVRDILRKHKKGKSKQYLADSYNVSYTTIHRIIIHENYRDV